jgi:hypothetical protein
MPPRTPRHARTPSPFARRAVPGLAALLFLALLTSALPAAPALAAKAEDMGAAVTGGKVSADLRYRYERVDRADFGPEAEAGTLRTRLGYRTGDLGGSNVFIEFENVVTLGPDDYDSTTNGRTAYPLVADPEGTEVNQVYLERRLAGGIRLRAGRQRIVLDNARFVGNVGWRQNEQTFDAVSLVDDHAPGVLFSYTYLWNVNRVTGADAAHDSHLIHLVRASPGGGAISLYGYLLDAEADPAGASATYGARYAGVYPQEDGRVVLTLEYANQGAYRGSGLGSNDYRLAEIGAVHRHTTAKVAYEVLGGDGTDAFQTPLATLHAFDGWADVFGTTPPAGLTDLAATLAVTARGTEIRGVYHAFGADRGGTGYGTEWDVRLEKRAGAHTFGAAWAAYAADGFGVDTDKLWVYTQASF